MQPMQRDERDGIEFEALDVVDEATAEKVIARMTERARRNALVGSREEPPTGAE